MDHFHAAHETLVDVLDEAVRLGFEVTVDDECGYWTSRSWAESDDVPLMMRAILRSLGG